MPLELFPFRFYDPVRKRWVRARYMATRKDIQARHERWQITGEPELRSDTAVDGAGSLARGPRER